MKKKPKARSVTIMVFWRKKKNIAEQEKQEREDKIIHHDNDPALEPPTEYDAEIDPDFKHKELEPLGNEILDKAPVTPVPEHTPMGDAIESEDLRDHTQEGGWFSKLTQGLSKSTNKIGQGISDIFTKKKLDADSLQDLEDLLIMADLGPTTSSALVEALSQEKFDKDIGENEVKEFLSSKIEEILNPVAQELKLEKPSNGPFTILVCGVNGVGKTTTIGKLSKNFTFEDKKRVMIAAADTFRAAAVEQLQIWGQRVHCPVFAKDLGADPAAVAFEAYEAAKQDNRDILIIDTAGRLHNKSNLMDELEKIIRVLKKHDDQAPHAVLLVLDATTGQNAVAQVETFKEIVNVTGLVITKLDGSAKAGIVISLAQKFNLPIHAIGVGEGAEDLKPFKSQDFANALIGVSE